MRTGRLFALALLAATAAACADGGPSGSTDRAPGQTDFTTEEHGASGRGNDEGARNPGTPTAGGTTAPGASADSAAKPPAPMGRMGQVEEGDIYRISGNRLFYLNTYRGFVVFDVTNPKQPRRLSRLPVHGYPIEMFVEGNTVYALLRDALYLTQKNGALEFERHNVSQLVTIDITDVENPRVLKTFDIVGELREGVARKIENTIYVVSYQSRWYWWGWRQPNQQEQKDQAFVYSYDVSNPAAPRQVQSLQLFEGGSVQVNDPKGGSYYSRNFSDVAISATSNALMVVENWQAYGYSRGDGSCGTSTNEQQAIVSVIDISDPKGTIRRHTRFETAGGLHDQFKMTYVFDDATKKGTFFGIFARQGWTGSNCSGISFVRNTLESWDITDGATPRRLQALDFGKPEETVHASAFDVERKVVYAITARRTDPLYAISIADPSAMKVLSAVDGLSGNMSLFRLIGGRQFLIGIGQDQSDTCTGFDDTNGGWRASKIAVSVIDVRDLARVRLVQRKCVAVENAEWIGSQLSWNMDQAHKMIGMHSDGTANVITVPVYYTKRVGDEWWGYRWETAVGMMTWDLARYDATKSETEQSVLENFGTFVHPEGEVRRSIVFTHAATQQRMMINLSDTHVSIANLADLRRPKLESVIELAPYVNQVYRFGDHIVEQVQSRQTYYSSGNTEVSTFRVKRAGGELEDRAPVASFTVGGVNRTYQHGNLLVLLRTAQAAGERLPGIATTEPVVTSEALIYDLSNPAAPKRVSRVTMPTLEYPWYHFRCGVGLGGYWFGGEGSNFAQTASGLVFIRYPWYGTDRTTALVALDLRNPAAPKVTETKIAGVDERLSYGLISDPSAPEGFYLWKRTHVGERRGADGAVFSIYRDWAQRWQMRDGGWSLAHEVSIPGQLVRTWKRGEERMFLTQDHVYRTIRRDMNTEWHSDTRLALLRGTQVNGRPAAELRDTRVFADLSLAALVLDGDRLFVNAQSQYWWGFAEDAAAQPSWEQTADRLMAFDLSGGALRTVYDRPMKAYGTQLMGTHKGKLFVNLPGDGILVVDVSNPAAPAGVHFLRTLGWASQIEFAGDDAYVAAGHFGLYHLSLSAAPSLPLE